MKILLTAAVVACIALSVGYTVHAAPGNVRYTVHNLSNVDYGGVTRRFNSALQDQVCIFCHTPHNAQPAVPLWNKVNPTQTFKMYSSGSLSSVAKGVQPGAVSLLCLSCHDGKTAINVLHNAANTATTAPGGKLVDIGLDYNNSDFGQPDLPTGGLSMGLYGGAAYGANLGKTAGDRFAGDNLTNDHPIGFSYAAALAASGGKLKAVADPKIRFFASNLECSSCHDPHVNYEGAGGDTNLRPFLVMSNVGSALCLTCHNK